MKRIPRIKQIFLFLCLLASVQYGFSQQRRPISSESPLWLIHIDVWNKADPRKIIDLIPEEIKPFVCFNLSLSCSYDTDRDVYKMPQNAIALINHGHPYARPITFGLLASRPVAVIPIWMMMTWKSLNISTSVIPISSVGTMQNSSGALTSPMTRVQVPLQNVWNFLPNWCLWRISMAVS